MARSRRKNLTDAVVAALAPAPPGGRYRVLDARLRGLWAVVGPRGVSFVASCAVGGKVRRRTLGHWPALDVETARARARDFIAAAANGRVRDRSALTLRAAWDRHRADLELRGRARRTIEGYECIWRVAADIMDVPLARLAEHPDLFARVFERMSARGNKTFANRALSAVRATYRFARRRLDRSLPVDPPTCAVMPHRERRRDTAFDRWTLPAWWKALRKLQNPARRAMHELILLTGARPGSVTMLRWEDVDLDARALRFEHVKTLPYAVPISDAIADCLSRAREAGALLHPAHAAEWVFPGKLGHVVEYKEKSLPRDAGSLRQTFASAAASIGVPTLMIGALLGHAARGVTEGYVTRAALIESLREAQDAISRELLTWAKARNRANRGSTEETTLSQPA